MHLADEEIQRLLHQELAEPARRNGLEHLGECTVCRERLEQAGREEREIFGLLERLDHPTPSVDIAVFMRAARPAPAPDWKRKAAVIALMLGGAGVAYAAPGSPLPGWIRTIVESFTAQRVTGPPAAPAAAIDSTTPTLSGLAVPAGTRLTVVFAAEQGSGTVTVRLTDGPDVVVRAVHGTAAFSTDVDRLTIANEGSAADYEIEVPRVAPSVELRVADRRMFLKRASHVESSVAPAGDGTYTFTLRP